MAIYLSEKSEQIAERWLEECAERGFILEGRPWEGPYEQKEICNSLTKSAFMKPVSRTMATKMMLHIFGDSFCRKRTANGSYCYHLPPKRLLLSLRNDPKERERFMNAHGNNRGSYIIRRLASLPPASS